MSVETTSENIPVQAGSGNALRKNAEYEAELADAKAALAVLGVSVDG